VVYMVFDVLWLDGHSTCELPYTDRRAVLERLRLAGPAWQTPPTAYGTGAHALRPPSSSGSRASSPNNSTYLQGSGPTHAVKPTAARARGRRLAPSRTAGTPPRSLLGLPRHGDAPTAGRAASVPASTVLGAICSRRSCSRCCQASPFVSTPPPRCGLGGTRDGGQCASTRDDAGVRAALRRTRRQTRGRRRPRDVTTQYRPTVTDDLAARRHRAGGAARDGAVAARARRRRAGASGGEPAAQRGIHRRDEAPCRAEAAPPTVRSAACRCW
jgi:hypothetical protein